MRPCSSGNSPTMPDTRSALASSAARCARAASHSSCEVAICRASSLTRSARSNCVPSFSWKVMPFSSSRMISSFFLRSCSQKNLASDKRAAITFSLPATMVLPPSLAFWLVTSRKWFDSFLPWRREKHFWCVFIDVVRHSAGTSRNALSNAPISTVGHSVRPAFSAASASSSTSVRCASLASACAPSLMRRGARGGIEHDLVLLQAPSRSRQSPSP